MATKVEKNDQAERSGKTFTIRLSDADALRVRELFYKERYETRTEILREAITAFLDAKGV